MRARRSPQPLRSRRARVASALVAGLLAIAQVVHAADAPVLVVHTADAPGRAPAAFPQVRAQVASRRSVRDPLPFPGPGGASVARATTAERVAAIRLALARAKERESEAAWDDCVREVAGTMSDAVDVLSDTGELELLRELHLQAGACLSVGASPASARTHFLAAALLDETPPRAGLHREAAEKVQAAAWAEVAARSRGKVRIETDPAGAEAWIDGKKVAGRTPVEVEARLGDHFITVRRFRFEPHTELRMLQPSGRMRIGLEPARRATLRDQLAALAGDRADRGDRMDPGVRAEDKSDRPVAAELRLAQAVWSRAEQLVVVSEERGALRLQVLDAVTGAALRTASVPVGGGDEAIRRGVCDALGETCEPSARGIPWYVWPLSGAAIAGGAVALGVILDANRGTRLCPPSGCP